MRLRTCGAGWKARTGPPTTASSSPSGWRSSRGRPTRPSHCSCRSCAPPGATTRASCSRCAPRWAGGCAARLTTRWLVSDGAGGEVAIKLAEDLTTEDWLPLAMERTRDLAPAGRLGAARRGRGRRDRAGQAHRAAAPRARRRAGGRRPADARDQAHGDDAPARSGARRAAAARIDDAHGDERHGGGERAQPRRGLLARGRALPRRGARDAPSALHWSFHPAREQHLVDEVAAYWLRHGVARPRLPPAPTPRVARPVAAGSAVVDAGARPGRTSYEQRLPDLIWDRPLERQVGAAVRALRGRRLVVAGQRRPERASSSSARSATSSPTACCGCSASSASSPRGGSAAPRSRRRTRTGSAISGADQVERAIALVPERDRPGVLASVARQAKRIAPTGYAPVRRRRGVGPRHERRAPSVRRTGLLVRGARHAHAS